MLKISFIFIVVIHGLIHFIGFLRAFGLLELAQLTKTITKPIGIMWLLVGLLIIGFGALHITDFDQWPVLGFVAVALSQFLIITAWQDAKAGTIANIIIMIVTLVSVEDLRFKQEAQELLSRTLASSQSVLSADDIQKLPDPVQRYYNYAIKDKTLKIQNVRVKHKGQFRTGPKKDWMEIKGEQYFSVIEPGFIWKGTTTFFTADDRYVEGNGRLTVKLLSLIKIIEVTGNHTDEAELQRWIAENFWFPINLFSNDLFRWKMIDDNHAELIFRDRNHDLSMVATFDEVGQLLVIECMRYMSKDHLENWRGYASEYIPYEGMMIPSRIEAVWVLESGDYNYANFKMEDIEYNVSEVY